MPNFNPLRPSRRTFLAGATALAIGAAPRRQIYAADTDGAVDIGARRELFLDDLLIERLWGNAQARLHHPTPQNIALVHDAPWEGSGSGYHSVFQDDGLYRMYYKAWSLDLSGGKLRTGAHPLYCCYAESNDGITWRKPELGLVEFRGSKANNIVLASGVQGPLSIDAGHPAVFKDENPAAPRTTRYKAIVRNTKPNGLLAFASPDGIHFSPMSDRPILTAGAFDSQNLAFWDPTLGKYRAYWRIFTTEEGGSSIRAIRTAVSDDFLHWEDSKDLIYFDSPPEQLYTNQIKPYHRAPHLLIGFPTRYIERTGEDSLNALPEREHRDLRSSASIRYGSAITEALLMASRDGVRFRRWNEAFLRPGIERPGSWNYGHQYIAWHVVETPSALEGAPPELSLYASESYWTGDSSAVRRYTLRLDGFVSIQAPMSGGELVTRPLRFRGDALRLNFSSSAAGGLRVEIQDPSGQPHPGFSLAECHEVFGDAIERTIAWKGGAQVTALAGKPVRLRFVLRDADLYAMQFVSRGASHAGEGNS